MPQRLADHPPIERLQPPIEPLDGAKTLFPLEDFAGSYSARPAWADGEGKRPAKNRVAAAMLSPNCLKNPPTDATHEADKARTPPHRRAWWLMSAKPISVRPLKRCLARRFPVAQVPRDTFQHHNGVVHQNATESDSAADASGQGELCQVHHEEGGDHQAGMARETMTVPRRLCRNNKITTMANHGPQDQAGIDIVRASRTVCASLRT